MVLAKLLLMTFMDMPKIIMKLEITMNVLNGKFFPVPNLIFRFASMLPGILGLENSFNWHHQTTSMLWMQFGVVWLLQSVLNNLMLLMKQWPNWEKILIRLVNFCSEIEILPGVMFEIRLGEQISQNVHKYCLSGWNSNATLTFLWPVPYLWSDLFFSWTWWISRRPSIAPTTNLVVALVPFHLFQWIGTW